MIVLTDGGLVINIDLERDAVYGDVEIFWTNDGSAIGWIGQEYSFDIKAVKNEGRVCFWFSQRQSSALLPLQEPLDQQHVELKAIVCIKQLVGEGLKRW